MTHMIMNQLLFQILNIVPQSLLDKSNFKIFDLLLHYHTGEPNVNDILAFLKDTLKTIDLEILSSCYKFC